MKQTDVTTLYNQTQTAFNLPCMSPGNLAMYGDYWDDSYPN